MRRGRLFRLLAASLAVLLLLPSVPKAAASDLCGRFADVRTDAWYHGGVHFALEHGLMNGVSTAQFSPAGTSSRAMLVTILYRLSGSPAAEGAAFSDVESGRWYARAVAWASQNGIVKGFSDGSFRPDSPVTREQTAAILYRYLAVRGLAEPAPQALDTFADGAAVSPFARDAMGWAVEAGILRGIPENGRTLLKPAARSTRAQLAVLLERVVNYAALELPKPETRLNEDVRGRLEQRLAGQRGRWAVYVEDLTDGSAIFASNSPAVGEALVSASLIKLWVMGAAFRQIERGRLSLASVRSDLAAMINVSDNVATNRLVRTLGGGSDARGIAEVNDFAASIGCTQTRMTRLMLQSTGTQNYVSAADCARFLKLVWSGGCVSKEASGQMLAILKNTERTYASEGLPPGVPFAHKTGTLTGLCYADVGVVAGSQPYILCLISNDVPDETDAKNTMIAISAEIYDLMK